MRYVGNLALRVFLGSFLTSYILNLLLSSFTEEYEPPKKRKNLRRCLVTASVPVFAHYALMSDVKSIRNEIVESLRQAVASGIFTHEGIDLENQISQHM
jgi:hypothetical protein